MILLLACISVDGIDTQVDVALSDGDDVLLTIGSCNAWSRMQTDFLTAADDLDEETALALYEELPSEFWEFRVTGDNLTATHILEAPDDIYGSDWVTSFTGEGAATDNGWEGTIDDAEVVLSWGEPAPCAEADLVIQAPLFTYF